MQVLVAEPSLDPILAPEHDGVRGTAVAQHIFGVVEPRLRKPLRSRHAGRIDHDLAALFTPDRGKIPDRIPEIRAVLDRPAMQLGVARLAGELHEARELGLRRPLGRRGPERAHCMSERTRSGMRIGFCFSGSTNTTMAAPSA